MRDRHIVPTKPRPELPLQQELFAAQTPAVFEPVLLGQMQDELARYRMREAFWISVVVHLVAVVVLALSPKWTEAIARLFPVRTVQVKSAEDLLRERNLTFLALPKDRQIPPKEVPEAKHLSDKNRIAQSPRPQLDQKTLDELRRHAGHAAAGAASRAGAWRTTARRCASAALAASREKPAGGEHASGESLRRSHEPRGDDQ